MKFFIALLTIAVAPLALAAPDAAADTFSIAAYSSDFCASSSTLVETIAGTNVYDGHCFSLAQPMSSLKVNMTGGCRITTFYLDRACTAKYGTSAATDNGRCQTFLLPSIDSFKVTC